MVMYQLNFPSLRVHNEANATRWTIFVCITVIVDRSAVRAYQETWAAYCAYMRPSGDPENWPWADILFALGASRTYGVTF